jgi:hypothetical protein
MVISVTFSNRSVNEQPLAASKPVFSAIHGAMGGGCGEGMRSLLAA